MPVKKSLEEKVSSYKLFWNRENTERPIIGFDVGGYFPLQSFTSLRGLKPGDELVPELIKPEKCLEDYERIQATSASVTDDFIRGVSPLTALPWMEAMLGCTAKLAEESIWAVERRASLEELEKVCVKDDRLIASSFPLSVVHLHSSSLFLLTHFLEIEEIDVFQVNRDVGGMDLKEMLPYLHKIQESKRCLIVRGTLTQRDLRLIKESLRSEGLLIQIVVNGCEEAEELQDVIGKLW
jgi:hypothetical protein